jgi:antitoxin FitA
MPVMLQVRSVPDEIHRTLKARAAARGVALSDYALEILRREVSRPTKEELLRRFAMLTPVKTRESTATIVRKGRASR